MFVFDELASNYIYKLEHMKIPDYPLETKYSQVTYWNCDGCGTLYTDTCAEDYFICQDFNSFEGTKSERMCESNCRDSWYIGQLMKGNYYAQLYRMW